MSLKFQTFCWWLLQEGNDLLHQNSTTDEFKDKVTTYLELLEVTKQILEAIYEISEEKHDKSFWKNLASQYRLIFIASNNTLL